MSLTFPVEAKIKDGSPVQLVLADNRDIESLRSLYRVIVGWLSSARFASLCRKGFVSVGGDGHEYRWRDAEPFGETRNLTDV
jgi:hypothetical protein